MYVCVVHESGAFVRILTHVGIFLCILTHHEAVMKQVSCYHLIIAPRVAHPNQAMFLLRELEYKFMQLECIIVRMHQNRMQRINMHLNALICIMFRMHTYGNAHECITCTKCMIMQQRMEMHRIIDAWKCIEMHQILNALWCNKCNAGKCILMHRTRMQPTWIRRNANECVSMQQIRNASK